MKVARAKGTKGSRSLSLDEVPSGKAVVPVPNKSSNASKSKPKPERTKHVSKVNNMEPMRGLKLVITDDGPPADWVKINTYRTVSKDIRLNSYHVLRQTRRLSFRK